MQVTLEPPSQPSPVATKKAGRTVALIIVFNLVIQVAEYAYFSANDVEPATAIAISLFTALVYYALAALVVMGRSAGLGIRPVTGMPTALVGAAEGFVVGGVASILLVTVFRLLAGRPLLDPTASLLVYQGSIIAAAFGVLLVVIAAPVVEELVFRGFLAEAFRTRGRRAAVLASGVAFAFAHLRLAQFRYYLLIGAVLALVYWRRGLVGSIAAHATFNGMLVVVAAAAAHGPGQTLEVSGAQVEVPATYEIVENSGGPEVAAVGPLGSSAEFVVLRSPAGPSVEDLAETVARRRLPFASTVSIDGSSAEFVDLPAGRGLTLDAEIEGRDGEVVLVPDGRRLWVAVFRSDGTERAEDDFDDMLESWNLP